MPVTEYIWDVDNDSLLMEADGDGNATAVYTNTPDPYGELVSQHRDGQTYFHHYDGEHNTRQVTDDSQNVVESATYSAFGETVAKTSSIVNPFGYKGALGYYTNGETDDIYVRARTYRPQAARWMTADAMWLIQGHSRYVYVSNRALVLTDPSGLVDCMSLPPKFPFDPSDRDAIDAAEEAMALSKQDNALCRDTFDKLRPRWEFLWECHREQAVRRVTNIVRRICEQSVIVVPDDEQTRAAIARCIAAQTRIGVPRRLAENSCRRQFGQPTFARSPCFRVTIWNLETVRCTKDCHEDRFEGCCFEVIDIPRDDGKPPQP